MDDELPMVAECGCRIEVIDSTLVLTACPAGDECPIVEYAHIQATLRGTPHSVLDMRDVDDG